MKEMFNFENLDELENYLLEQSDIENLQENLFNQFIKHSDYKNAEEWNKSVLICESLAIIGWGNHEALEALRGIFYNGNPMTYFINKFGEFRFIDAIWSKRKNGFTMEQGRTSYHFSPDDINKKKTILWDYPTKLDIQDVTLKSQRNWIRRNPIQIVRGIGNCYENSKKIIDSLEENLQLELNHEMRPEKYGKGVHRIILRCAFSYFDNHCKTNYIIAESDRKLSNEKAWTELHKMYPKKEIEENGYFLRNRYEYGPFRSDTGKVITTIHLEKEFSELDYNEQKIRLSDYFITALTKVGERVKKRKPNYDFDLLLYDFNKILINWKTTANNTFKT